MSVCLWDSLTSPIKQNHPVMFTILLSAEEIRIRSTFIYVAVGIAAHSSLTAFFYGHMGDGSRGGFHTNTQLVSPCRAVIFSAALLMKQTDLHWARCITCALIAVHYIVSCLTFIQGSVVTWGPLRRRNEAICLYAECSKRRSRVQDNRFLFFFTRMIRHAVFSRKSTKQVGYNVRNVSDSWLKTKGPLFLDLNVSSLAIIGAAINYPKTPEKAANV